MSFPSLLLEVANGVFSEAPWKHIPGPWIMKVDVKEVGTRFIVLTGVTAINNRGMWVFNSFGDYNSYCIACKRNPAAIPTHLRFLFEEGKKKNPQLFVASMGGIVQHPPSASDVTFCEAALIAVARFVSEAARLGGDSGEHAQPVPESPLPPNLVLARVMEGGPFMDQFPCTQAISTSQGERTVVVTVIPTQSTMMHLTTRGATKTTKPVVSMPKQYKICIVCRKTESDVRTSTGGGLKKCGACNSDTDKYCSAECQRSDWKRHKVHCKK